AFGAIGGVNPAVAKPDLHLRQRQLLAVGVEPQRHRRAGAERRQQEIVRTWTAVESADVHRLVRYKTVGAGNDLLLELAAPRFAHDDGAGRGVLGVAMVGWFGWHRHLLRSR